jgi:hypothetical protein
MPRARKPNPPVLDTLLKEVVRDKTVVVIRNRRNRPIAAMIPVENIEMIERIEDEIDIHEARKALKGRMIPWEKVKRNLGL